MIERDETIINALANLLESNIGYEISLYGLLNIYQLEDLRFVVNRYENNAENPDRNKWIYEEIFEDARKAVEFFEQKRREYELGFDIEGELIRDELNQKK